MEKIQGVEEANGPLLTDKYLVRNVAYWTVRCTDPSRFFNFYPLLFPSSSGIHLSVPSAQLNERLPNLSANQSVTSNYKTQNTKKKRKEQQKIDSLPYLNFFLLILLLFFLNTMLQFSYSISLTWKSPLLIRNGGYLLRLLGRQLMSRRRDGGGLGKKFACMWFWWRGVERALTRTRRRSKTHETPSS